MDSPPTFRELSEILLHAALKPPINKFSLHYSYVALSSYNSNPFGQYFMNYFPLVREIPQIRQDKKKGINIVLK